VNFFGVHLCEAKSAHLKTEENAVKLRVMGRAPPKLCILNSCIQLPAQDCSSVAALFWIVAAHASESESESSPASISACSTDSSAFDNAASDSSRAG
jgi:hypothetical protein